MICRVWGLLLPKDDQDPNLRKWLESRIDEALSDDSAPDKHASPEQVAGRPDDDMDEAPTDPGAPLRAIHPTTVPLGPTTWVDLDEDEEDPETVLGRAGWSPGDEDEGDPETVLLAKMPVSFIGESVMDDHTAVDGSEAARTWRQATAGLRREVLMKRAEDAEKALAPTVPPGIPRPPPLSADPPTLIQEGPTAPRSRRWVWLLALVLLAAVVGTVVVVLQPQL